MGKIYVIALIAILGCKTPGKHKQKSPKTAPAATTDAHQEGLQLTAQQKEQVRKYVHDMWMFDVGADDAKTKLKSLARERLAVSQIVLFNSQDPFVRGMFPFGVNLTTIDPSDLERFKQTRLKAFLAVDQARFKFYHEHMIPPLLEYAERLGPFASSNAAYVFGAYSEGLEMGVE